MRSFVFLVGESGLVVVDLFLFASAIVVVLVVDLFLSESAIVVAEVVEKTLGKRFEATF